jgi:hypothetical protein
VKSLANVKLCKDLNVSDSGERFVDQGKQVLVFLYKAIKLTIVYIKAQAAVRLSNKEHRRGKERAAKHNKAFVKVFLQVLFNSKELFSSHLVKRIITEVVCLCKLNLVVYSCAAQEKLV